MGPGCGAGSGSGVREAQSLPAPHPQVPVGGPERPAGGVSEEDCSFLARGQVKGPGSLGRRGRGAGMPGEGRGPHPLLWGGTKGSTLPAPRPAGRAG